MKMSWKYSSPNYSSRHGAAIDTIIVHHTAGSAPGCMLWLCNPNPKDADGNELGRVSAHTVITKDGTVYELVKPEFCAWHAGRGAFDYNKDGVISEDEKTFNRRSLGIELESKGDVYTDVQMVALVELIQYYRAGHDIHTERILGHKEIAPQRKHDPGHFNMVHLRHAVISFNQIRQG